ncbi:hypothetical protein [Planococcus maritimus]|nr:hypothetical protein [Planococcus maritimus]
MPEALFEAAGRTIALLLGKLMPLGQQYLVMEDVEFVSSFF